MGETFEKTGKEGMYSTALFLLVRRVKVAGEGDSPASYFEKSRGKASSRLWCGYLPFPRSLMQSCID